MFVDTDAPLRPVNGHHKQGASFGHAKIAQRALLRRAAPVDHHAVHAARGAAHQLKQAITTARAIDRHTALMARGDSAYGTRR